MKHNKFVEAMSVPNAVQSQDGDVRERDQKTESDPKCTARTLSDPWTPVDILENPTPQLPSWLSNHQHQHGACVNAFGPELRAPWKMLSMDRRVHQDGSPSN
jgi:hypothetical protein